MLRSVGLLTLMTVSLTTIGMSAQAIPSANATAERFKSASRVEPIAQRCWWHRGERHCRRHGGYRVYGYTGPHYPEAYRTGSGRWWQEMDRAGRGGRGGRN
jgi:hypothetical protein